jgi:hypothetical protein
VRRVPDELCGVFCVCCVCRWRDGGDRAAAPIRNKCRSCGVVGGRAGGCRVCVCVRARARAARRSAGRSVQLAATRRCVRELVCVCVCVTVCVVCASERAWPRRRAAATTSKLQ